jgi:heparan-alpha-glucosaminide N-acetyltransferase
MCSLYELSKIGLIGLSICYVLIDIKGWWNGAPFLYPGMNSIAVYCGHEILDAFVPFHFITSPGYTTHAPYLTENLIGVGCWVIIAWYWFSIDFFVKI